MMSAIKQHSFSCLLIDFVSVTSCKGRYTHWRQSRKSTNRRHVLSKFDCRRLVVDIVAKVEHVQLGRLCRKWLIFVDRMSNVLSTSSPVCTGHKKDYSRPQDQNIRNHNRQFLEVRSKSWSKSVCACQSRDQTQFIKHAYATEQSLTGVKVCA